MILSVALVLHGTNLKLGLRVQNTFGIFVLIVMVFIALVGQLVLLFPSLAPISKTDNLEWGNLWKDTRLEANAFVTALYNVIWYVCMCILAIYIYEFHHSYILQSSGHSSATPMRTMPCQKFETLFGRSKKLRLWL